LDEIDVIEASLTYSSELPTDVGLEASGPSRTAEELELEVRDLSPIQEEHPPSDDSPPAIAVQATDDDHIPKTKDELRQEMDVLAASLTAGLNLPALQDEEGE
ncbi:unnamed protein product, partial [Symbiodinium pilosum]